MTLRTLTGFFLALILCSVKTSAQTNAIESLLIPQHGIPYDADKMYYQYGPEDNISDHPYYDRFGNPIPISLIGRRPDGNPNTMNNGPGGGPFNTTPPQTAGHFVLHYAENGVGFDGPNGATYQAVLEQVCKDLSALIATPPKDPCTQQPAKVHLLINSGTITDPQQMGGATSSYNKSYGNNMVIDGEVWKVLVTGKASENNIMHGYIDINFNAGTPIYAATTPIATDAVGKVDLYSVFIHELFHALGFCSKIDFDGQSKYMKTIGKSYFTRFDLLMKRNGNPVVTSSTPSKPFYNLSCNLTSTTTIKTCSEIKAFGGSCAFLKASQGIFSPSPYKEGSSLSHFDGACADGNGVSHTYIMEHEIPAGVIRRMPDQSEVQLLNELGYKTTGTFGESVANIYNYRSYTDGPKGQSMADKDITTDCVTGRPVKSVTSCSGTKEVILDHEGTVKPTSIEGVEVVSGSSFINTPTAVGVDKITFKATLDAEGFAVIQYVPVYGCIRGNIVRILIYTYPCHPQACIFNNDPLCAINCDPEMDQSIYSTGSNCTAVSGSGGQGFSYEVIQWPSINRTTTPDYFKFSDGKYGIGMCSQGANNPQAPNHPPYLGWSEGVYNQVRLKAGRSYRFKISAKRQGGTNVEPCPTTPYTDNTSKVRFRAIKATFNPWSDNDGQHQHFLAIDNYITSNFTTDLITDIDPTVFASGTFTQYDFCYTPQNDFDYIGVYVDAPDNKGGYIIFDLIEVVEIQPTPTPVLVPCQGAAPQVTLALCTLNSDLTVNWIDPLGNIISTGASAPIQKLGDYKVNTYYTSSNGTLKLCSSQPVTAISESGLQVTGAVYPSCFGSMTGSIDLTVTGGNPNGTITYLWSNGATSQDISNIDPGVYTVSISYGNCYLTKSFQVNSGPTKVIVTQSKPFICGTEGITLSASPNQPFYWSKDGTLISNQPTNSITITEGGVYQIVLAQNSCYYSDPITITKYPVPTISANGSTVICDNYKPVLHVDNYSSNIQWGNSAGTISGATSVNYTANTTGAYSVTYTNGSCILKSNEITITQQTAPIISVSGSMVICDNYKPVLHVDNYSTGIQWYLAGQAISGQIAVNCEAAAPGIYYATYTNGSCTVKSNQITITQQAAPVISISGSTVICDNYKPVLHINNYSTNIQWYNSGQVISGATSINYTATTPGTYYVTYTNGNCTVKSNEIIITQQAAPVISINGSTVICDNYKPVFHVDNYSTGIQWYNAGQVISGATAVNYEATTPGTYYVTYTNGSCMVKSNEIIITKQAAPIISVNGPTKICDNYTPILHVNNYSTGIQWYNTSGAISGATSIDYTTTNAGSYYVTYTNGGCTVKSNTLVITKPTPPTITANGLTTFCQGNSVQLSTLAIISGTYQWYNKTALLSGETTETTSATVSGSYKVVYNDGAGCELASNSISVTVKPLPIVNAGGPIKTYCTTVRLGGNPTATGGGGNGSYTYLWTPNTSNLPAVAAYTNTLANPTVTPSTSPKIYTVTVTSNGCSASASVKVIKAPVENNIIEDPILPCNPTASLTIPGKLPVGGDGNYSYFWERQNPLTGTWGPAVLIGGNNQDLVIFAPTVGQKYRRVVRSGNCPDSYSNTVTITALTEGDNIPFAVASADFSEGQSITHDKNGNIYTAGTFKNNMLFPTPLTSLGSNFGVFIAKHSPCGKLKWTITGKGSPASNPDQFVHTVKVDDNNGVFVMGNISGDDGLYFIDAKGNSSLSIAQQNNYLASFDQNGAVKNTIGIKEGGASAHLSSLAVDPVNNYLFVSGNTSTLRFIKAFDKNLNLLWTVSVPLNSLSRNWGLAALEGQLILTSSSTFGPSNFNFDNTNVVLPQSGMIVLSLDYSHSVVWKKYYPGTDLDNPKPIVEKNGSTKLLYISGFFTTTAFEGTYTLSNTSGSSLAAFLLRADASNGNLNWTKMLDQTPEQQLYPLGMTTDQNNIYLNVIDLADFSSTLHKYSSTGSSLYKTHTNPTVFDISCERGSTSTTSNRIRITGLYSGNVSFGSTNLSSTSPNGEFFVAELNSNGVFSLQANEGKKETDQEFSASGTGTGSFENNKNLSIFPNPTKGELIISGIDGSKTHIKLTNALGQPVFDKDLSTPSGRTELDLSRVPVGLYTISIINNGNTEIRKVEIMR